MRGGRHPGKVKYAAYCKKESKCILLIMVEHSFTRGWGGVESYPFFNQEDLSS